MLLSFQSTIFLLSNDSIMLYLTPGRDRLSCFFIVYEHAQRRGTCVWMYIWTFNLFHRLTAIVEHFVFIRTFMQEWLLSHSPNRPFPSLGVYKQHHILRQVVRGTIQVDRSQPHPLFQLSILIRTASLHVASYLVYL